MDNQEKNRIQLPEVVSFTCPYCSANAQFNLIFPYPVHMKYAYWEENEISTIIYEIRQCQVCNRLVFRAWKIENHLTVDPNDKKIKKIIKLFGQFPSTIRVDSNFSGSVPKEILEDFESALKCFEFGEYRPAVVMCRRALQASLLEQGADPKKDLIEQIDELNKSNPDKLTPAITDWAHNIRTFGNWGAHPDKDGLKDVNQEIAKDVIDFLKSYFHYVYVMPKKVNEARAKQKPREQKK